MHFATHGDLIRAEKIRQFLIDGDYDIIGLCEVYNPSLRKILLGTTEFNEKYPYAIYGLSTYKTNLYTFENGLVIISKHPIINARRYQYKSFIDKSYNKLLPPKDVIFAEIDYNGNSICVAVTHLQWGLQKLFKQTRIKQMSELREELNNCRLPTIIMGDFNIFDGRDSDEYRYFINLFSEYIDWHTVLHNVDTPTWDPKNSKVVIPKIMQKLDFIFSTREFLPTKSEVKKFRAVLDFQSVHSELLYMLSKKERLWYGVLRILRIVFLPIIVIYYLFINIYRLLFGYPLLLRNRKKDLSDHYALEGEAIFNDKK